jgi:hypothetical protein
MTRLLFIQSDRWFAVSQGLSGVDSVYSTKLCCYCSRPVRADASRLRTARTNDGEWWLVSADIDMAEAEWRDFQRQTDDTFAPTVLPIGPDCLRRHPEFRFALVQP